MSSHLRFTTLGKLEIIETYEYYDRPLLFACRNTLGHVYLALLVDEDEMSETWFYVGVSQTRFEYVRTGGIDLRTAFAEPEDGTINQVEVFHDDNRSPHVTIILAAQVGNDFLPEPGEFLSLQSHTLPVLAENLLEKAHQAKREFLRLKFIFPDMPRSEAPSKPLGKVLDSLQDIIDAIGQALAIQQSSKTGVIPKNFSKRTEMRLVNVGAGSFEVELVASDMVNLFDESDVGNALDEFIRLVDIGNNIDKLKERLSILKIKTASKYLQFLNSLSQRIDSTSFELASPKNSSLYRAQMSSETAEQIIEAIRTTDVEEPIDFFVRGTLIGANLKRKTYEITVKDSDRRNKNYAGKISASAFDFVSSATLSREYSARLRTTKILHPVTGDVQTMHELLALE